MASSARLEDHRLHERDGAPHRSTGDLVQEVVGHVEEIVRSEIRLAKVEIKEEAAKAGKAGGMIAGAALFGFLAVACFVGLCTAALALAIPVWAALLCMAVLCGIIAAGALSAGMTRLKQVRAVPPRTVQTLRDDVSWLKNQT
jgi:uncharacterized membrane protein YqjE